MRLAESILAGEVIMLLRLLRPLFVVVFAVSAGYGVTLSRPSMALANPIEINQVIEPGTTIFISYSVQDRKEIPDGFNKLAACVPVDLGELQSGCIDSSLIHYDDTGQALVEVQTRSCAGLVGSICNPVCDPSLNDPGTYFCPPQRQVDLRPFTNKEVMFSYELLDSSDVPFFVESISIVYAAAFDGGSTGSFPALDFEATTVPEPSPAALRTSALLALATLAWIARRAHRRKST